MGTKPTPITQDRLTFVRFSQSVTPVTITVSEARPDMGLYAMQEVIKLITSENYTLHRWNTQGNALTYAHPDYEDVQVVYHGAPHGFQVVWQGSESGGWYLHKNQPKGRQALWRNRGSQQVRELMVECHNDHPGCSVRLRPVF